MKVPTGGMQPWNTIAVSPRAPSIGRVSRSGATPEPTVIVRMKENVRTDAATAARTHVIALGDVSIARKEITHDTHPPYARKSRQFGAK